MKKILVGSPIRQKSNILKEFLLSLEELDKADLQVDYYFVDDNIDKESSKLLKDFSKKYNVVLKIGQEMYQCSNSNYECTRDTHFWKRDLIEKITYFKDCIIEHANQNNYDYLFFIDSDIVLNKKTLKHLMSRNLDIVSNVFWSQWYPDGGLEPQVWLQDTGNCYIDNWDKELTIIQKEQSRIDFFTGLRIPGLYEVGGLGALTLISKKAIKAGCKFKLIDNVSFWGEDRHFCIRAEALGFKLYLDTVYPAYHIYRECYLDRVDEFKKDGFKFDMCIGGGNIANYSGFKKIKQKFLKILKKIKDKLKLRKISKFNRKRTIENKKIVLTMIVHNESNRYLEQSLKSAIEIADEVLIIDDASTDNTVQICEEILKNKPHKIIKNKKSMFHKEYKLRTLQWKETLKLNPGWILNLDADEVLEDSAKEKLKHLMNVDDIDVLNLRLFDMWNENEYRDDEYWNAHNRHMISFIRYQPKFKYKFKKTNQHCGRLPKNISKLKQANVEVFIKHFGWARESDRKYKYERYMKLDKNSKCGIKKQYESILDKNPNLKRFDDYGKK